MTRKPHYNLYLGTKLGVIHSILKSDGQLVIGERIALPDVMYMAQTSKQLYAVLRAPFEATGDSGIQALEVNDNGVLACAGQPKSTGGAAGTYIHVDTESEAVYVANYLSGSVHRSGGLQVLHYGVNETGHSRQEAPHPHQIVPVPESELLCVPDLGLDKLFFYTLDLEMVDAVAFPKAFGPRHMVFKSDGASAYCVGELDGSLCLVVRENGQYRFAKQFPAICEAAFPSAIRITRDGEFLLVARRGQHVLDVYATSETSDLSLVNTVACGGLNPRDFILTPDGSYVICVHTDTCSVSVFRRDGAILTEVDHKLLDAAPSCVLFREEFE